MIQVVNKKTFKNTGYGIEYIGRPSVFGNPFRIKDENERPVVIKQYEDYFRKHKDLMMKDELDRLAYIAKNIDLYLVCWCAPKLCHGNIIKLYLEWRLMYE